MLGAVVKLIGLWVGLAALVALCVALLPDVVARARRNAARMPVRSFFVGLLNVGFFGLLALAFLASKGPGQGGARVIGAALATLVLCGVAVGLAAVAAIVGDRLRPDDPSALRRALAGAVTLELATLVPLVGWFVLPALICCVGCGATIIALIWRRAPDTAPADAGAPPPGAGSPVAGGD
ncbi:MAG TPA: hypothetical protein VFL91_32740 [Thermomicrobiales bacterium]|nr:hypothetical protein [Thermomicrobiales bacterium]